GSRRGVETAAEGCRGETGVGRSVAGSRRGRPADEAGNSESGGTMSEAEGAGALDWDGAVGAFWVREQERRDATLAPFNAPLLDAAGVGAGAAVLDVGCGCGATTRDAAGRGADPVVGIDPSSPMLDRARELAVGNGAIEFVRGDA